jgi:hypothetical protein
VIDSVPVQIDHRKTQIIIAPDQFSLFDAKCGEAQRIQPFSEFGMHGAGQEGLEIHDLFPAIIEDPMQTIISHWAGRRDLDDGRCRHFSLRVMRSGVILNAFLAMARPESRIFTLIPPSREGEGCKDSLRETFVRLPGVA